MNEPRNEGGKHAEPSGRRQPSVVVAWASAQLRDKIQRTAALTDPPRDTEPTPEPEPDREPEREAEP